jgi:hypothetical protein
MAPHFEPYPLLVIAYWLAMIPIAAVILAKVTGYCIDDSPSSFSRAVLIVVAVAAGVFFAYDLSGYFFARLMQDPDIGVRLPPQFTYWDWLREPVALKWQVLGYVPFIRFIPVGIALIVGAVLQIFIWNITFKFGLLIFLAQLFLDLSAMVLLSYAFRIGIELYERSAVPAERPQPGQHREPEGFDPKSEPSSLAELERRVRGLGAEAGPFWRRLDRDWESVNGHLRPLYRRLQPVTEHLPPPVQDFLNAGGWIALLAGLGGLALAWPWFHRRRRHIHQYRTHRRGHARRLPIALAVIGDAVTGLGPKQATVRGTPARLRLVVVAPSDSKRRTPHWEPLAGFLDAIHPGLGGATANDYPRVEVRPGPVAPDALRPTLESAIQFPEAAGRPSRWVVAVGEVAWAGSSVPVGLGFFADQPTAARVIEVQGGRWSEAVGVRDVPVDERE